ncbi:MAG: hypothetical protein K2M13_00760 [Muribaculaceae bacterium]|nr:hypothetical protein [Muribaculaceae bacterium]
MKKILITFQCIVLTLLSYAQNVNDTLVGKELQEVVVQAKMQRTSATVSTYYPSAKQKNAAQTGGELLNSMAIPQLRISDGINIETSTGKPVDVFINYLPASQQDLVGMRISDVKKIEYYDYPTDPRFQGAAHVVNIVMQRYEYGGYVKVYGNENFIVNSGQLNLFSKFQYKKMTYDIAAGGYYMNSDHNGYEKIEYFRLPKEDGSTITFDRLSSTGASRLEHRDYWATFKAIYQTDKITLSNIFAVDFNHKPENNQEGSVVYIGDFIPSSSYISYSSNRVNSFTYNGYWNFVLSSNNTLTVSPNYSYSHTNQYSDYAETGFQSYINGATDDSHQLRADISFTHKFGGYGTLKAICNGLYRSNSTVYSGTSDTKDRAETYRLGPGLTYSLSKGGLYFLVGLGLHWDKSSYGDYREHSMAPWSDLSVQYSFNSKNSVGMEFHFHKSIPSSNYRSSSVIKADPLMEYTGNPALYPYKSYDISAKYTFLPSNTFNLSVYGSTWIVQDRYVYDYEASSSGILRTIKQPMGSYAQGQYGIYGSARLLSRKLQFGASLSHNLAHNGAPYNWTKSYVSYAIQAYYYLGAFNFGASYISSQGYPDGCMVGTWMRVKDQYSVQAGWSNSSWNIRVLLKNFARWNWNSSTAEVNSENYGYILRTIDTIRHASIQLSATYTFGFGKKIKRGDEASQQSVISSGILK